MTINVNDYSDTPLPGCEQILIDAENYIDFRNHLVSLLGSVITQSEAIRMYDIIVGESPSKLIDAREYVLNELQYEIRRTTSGTLNIPQQENEGKILQDWAVSLAQRTNPRTDKRSDIDDTLDLISIIKDQRINRKNKY